jgi:ribosomal protein L44E
MNRGSSMPKKGDTVKGYCGKCRKETTWLWVERSFKGQSMLVLECLGCGQIRA